MNRRLRRFWGFLVACWWLLAGPLLAMFWIAGETDDEMLDHTLAPRKDK